MLRSQVAAQSETGTWIPGLRGREEIYKIFFSLGGGSKNSL